MKSWTFFLTIVFFLVIFNAQAQSSSGSLADTVLADQLLKEMRSLIKESKWAEAEASGEQARAIYESLLGEDCRQMGDVWHHMGRVYGIPGKYDQAIVYYQKSVNIRLKTLGETHVNVGWSYNNIANCFHSKGEYDKAIEYNEKALQIRLNALGENHSDVGASFNNLGTDFESKGQYDKAVECYKKSLQIFSNTLGENHAYVASTLNNLGLICNVKGDYNQAIDYCWRALKIWSATLGENHPDVAAGFDNLANSFAYKGEYDEAIIYHQKSLQIRLNTLGENHPDIAGSFNNLGLTLSSKGENDKAIEYYQKALQIRLNAFGHTHPDVASSLSNLGLVLGFKGEYDMAIEYHQSALKIWLSTLGENHRQIAIAYNGLGVNYDSKKEYEKAIEYFKKAAQIWSNTVGENHPDVANALNNIGNIFSVVGDNDKALEYHQKALQIRLNVLGEGHPDVAYSFNNLGDVFSYKGEYEKADEYYQKSLQIRLNVLGENHPTVANSYIGFGLSYYLKGDYSKALPYFQRALNIRSKSFEEINPAVIISLSVLAKVYYKTHQIDSALYYVRQAINAIQVQAISPVAAQTKSLYQSENLSVFEQAIEFSLAKANLDNNPALKRKTFEYTEMSKATLLQAQIKAAEALAFAGIPDSLLHQERNLRVSITWREKQRQGLLEQGFAETDTTVLNIGSIAFNLKKRYETLKNRFETEYPEYYRLQYDLSTVNLSYVQDTLLEKDHTLVEYFTGDSAVYVFTIRPDTFTVTVIKKDFPLDSLVGQLRKGIYGYYQKGIPDAELYYATAREYTTTAYTLYNKLVKPIASLLTENVVIVPDGVLGYVPFDALLTERPANPTYFHTHQYLGRDHRISYAYSATLLREMRDKKHSAVPVGSVIAIAPFFRGDATALREQLDTLSELIALRADTLKALEYSGREALVAEKILKGRVLLGLAATKDTFQALAGDYRILHLSTHGKANDRMGDYGYLAFARSDTAFEKLFVKDIYNLSLQADLVVLSACETGIGQLQRGEGIISLARAFAYAGAKSIVTTLWQVDDARTSRLMQHFYKNLHHGMPKNEALWRAKRTLFTGKKDSAHPFFWAGFIPIGDMSALRD